jgi:hypothetical protein
VAVRAHRGDYRRARLHLGPRTDWKPGLPTRTVFPPSGPGSKKRLRLTAEARRQAPARVPALRTPAVFHEISRAEGPSQTDHANAIGGEQVEVAIARNQSCHERARLPLRTWQRRRNSNRARIPCPSLCDLMHVIPQIGFEKVDHKVKICGYADLTIFILQRAARVQDADIPFCST